MKSVLRVRDDSGREIPIPAIRGEDGHTPKKGVDYYTEEEKAEFRDEVLAALPFVELVATFDDGSTEIYEIYSRTVI